MLKVVERRLEDRALNHRGSGWRRAPRASGSRDARPEQRAPMDLSIAGILALDGLTNGAVYALLALATVLVFAVTRVIFIPQGEFVAFGALTLRCCRPARCRAPCGSCWCRGRAAARGGDLVDGCAPLRQRAGRVALREAARTLALPVACRWCAIWARAAQLAAGWRRRR